MRLIARPESREDDPIMPKSQTPAQSPAEKVEELYESCCGSCAPAPKNDALTLQDLTVVPQGTEAESKR